MTPHEVLVAAKGYLLNHGWIQEFRTERGAPTCINGAVYWSAANADESVRDRAYVAVTQALGFKDPFDNARWNDEKGRTIDEVIDTLDRAILATAPTPEPQTPALEQNEET